MIFGDSVRDGIPLFIIPYFPSAVNRSASFFQKNLSRMVDRTLLFSEKKYVVGFQNIRKYKRLYLDKFKKSCYNMFERVPSLHTLGQEIRKERCTEHETGIDRYCRQ